MIAADHPRYSISYLQRKLRIGYNRAANIAEKLEKEGYGPEKPGYSGQNRENDPPDDEGEADEE